jgi:putative chitinase
VSDDLDHDFVNNPGDAASLTYSAAIARWYWTVARDINSAADRLDMGAVDDAIGYAPEAAEDTERCNDFKAALKHFTGSVPAGINCTRR